MEQLNPVSLLLAACGIVCCFFGYRTARLLLDISGFVVVGLLSLLAGGVLTEGNLMVMFGALVVGGILGAVLAHFIYKLGLALFGGGLSALIAWSYADIYLEANAFIAAVVVAAVVGGIASLFLQRFTLSLITAGLGAWFTVEGVFLLLEAMEITPVRPEAGERLAQVSTMVLAWVILTGMGFIFQLVSARRKKASGE